MKVNTQYMWTSRLIETMHIAAERAAGGKGGGGKGGGSTSYTISYTYSVHTAIGVCRGPVAQCNRIWAGGKLMWTNPNQVKYIQRHFDEAYEAETSRLLELGVPTTEAHVSGYFFAYNAYMMSATLTIWSANSAVIYIMSHPVNGSVLNYWDVYGMVVQLFDPVQWDKNFVPSPIRFDSVVVYNGDEFQEPDPTMQAYLGAGAVPGYRGICYIMINNLQLADFGNTVPQFTVEVMKDGTLTYSKELVPPGGGWGGGPLGGHSTAEQITSLYGNPPAYLNKTGIDQNSWNRYNSTGILDASNPFWTAVPTTATNYVVDAVPKDVTLIQIINDILAESGLKSEDFDTTTAIPGSIVVHGYAVTQPTSTRQVLQDLQKIFAFDGCESGYKIKFKMLNERPRAIIRREDLGAHIDSDDMPPSVEQTRASELDMPRRLNFKYQEPARNYSINTVWAMRQTGVSLTAEDMDITIALNRAMAKQLVEAALAARFKMRNTYKVLMPRKYIVLEPGDVVLIPDKEYANQWTALRVIDITIGANGILEITFCDSDFLVTDQPAITGEDIDVSVPTLPTPSRTYAYMLDIPLLNDIIPDTPGFFVVLTGTTGGWKGGSLLVDLSDPGNAPAYGAKNQVPTQGSSWFQIATGQVQVAHGFALKTLDPTVAPGVWDRKSEVIVYLMNPQAALVNADPLDMMTQALNTCYIGGEVVAFANAEDLGNGKWKLTQFLRGLRGTDYAIPEHVGTEKFVMLNSSAVQRVVETQAALNKEASYVALSSGQSVADEQSFKFTNTGNSLRPFAPVIMRYHLDEGDNFTMSWQPRNRINGRWLSGQDITLDQATEAYSIDVETMVDDEWVVQATYDLGAVRSWSYSASQQITDVGFSGAGIRLSIYQIGDIIGRGFPSRVTF